MKKTNVLVLRTAGTNCDLETAHAFKRAGASADLIHVNEIGRDPSRLRNYRIMAIPGGFTYGDDIASGKILANEIRHKFGVELRRFVKDGKLIIGICNGFQVLVKAGLLPGLAGKGETTEATLTFNDSARFEDRWVYLKTFESRCVWTKGIDPVIYLPVAHGEGKFIPRNASIRSKLADKGLIVFSYADVQGCRTSYPGNPNGSIDDIAGICDPSGRIFGLMPHPERHIHPTHHPHWTRKRGRVNGDGLAIFRNGVRFAERCV